MEQQNMRHWQQLLNSDHENPNPHAKWYLENHKMSEWPNVRMRRWRGGAGDARFEMKRTRNAKEQVCPTTQALRLGYATPTDVLHVRAAKIADEIFAICADLTPGELTQHQLVTAVIARELRKQHNDKAEPLPPDSERVRH